MNVVGKKPTELLWISYKKRAIVILQLLFRLLFSFERSLRLGREESFGACLFDWRVIVTIHHPQLWWFPLACPAAFPSLWQWNEFPGSSVDKMVAGSKANPSFKTNHWELHGRHHRQYEWNTFSFTPVSSAFILEPLKAAEPFLNHHHPLKIQYDYKSLF